MNINVILPSVLWSPTLYFLGFLTFCIYRLPINATFSAHHFFFAVAVLNRMKNSQYEGLPYVIITIFLLLSMEMKCDDVNFSWTINLTFHCKGLKLSRSVERKYTEVVRQQHLGEKLNIWKSSLFAKFGCFTEYYFLLILSVHFISVKLNKILNHVKLKVNLCFTWSLYLQILLPY